MHTVGGIKKNIGYLSCQNETKRNRGQELIFYIPIDEPDIFHKA